MGLHEYRTWLVRQADYRNGIRAGGLDSEVGSAW
jgi:hypothetical protein